jgi:hypothetical protein
MKVTYPGEAVEPDWKHTSFDPSSLATSEAEPGGSDVPLTIELYPIIQVFGTAPEKAPGVQ